jgi:hypothetical protein
MDNTANKNRTSARVLTPEVQLQSLCDVLNDARQPERRDAFRALVKRWLAAGSLEQLIADNQRLWRDVSEAWKPCFTYDGSGAAWGVSLIPSESAVPATAEEWAIGDFALLMLNPLRGRLRGPCRRPGCERYYIKKRETKVYCSKICGNAASATRSNAALDKAKREALLKSAAKFWPQWTPRKHPNRSFWIASRVNGSHVRMRTKTGWTPVRDITGKWISRNAAAIQRAVRNGG